MSSQGPIGRQFGNYTVQRLLGEGGMGAVYEGHHRYLGDRVAIKVLHGTYAHNQKISQRFFQEAKAARDIGHKSIIQVIDFGQSPDDGCLYLVMELLDGGSLAEVIAKGPMPEEQAARIIAAVADGLQVAHEKGVIHRDLKPDNLFLVGDGVKILDFGIAKVVSGVQNTGTGAMLGTPRYMAPEQARGAKQVGPQSDVYSLGVILYQMVTGQVPFDGELTEVLLKVLSDEPVRPSTLAPVSPEMEALILCCMAKDPAGRPASMLDLRARLTPWAGPPENPERIANATTIALGEGRGRSVRPITTLSQATGERKSPTVPESPSQRRAMTIGIAAALAIGVGVGAFALTRPKPTAAIAPPQGTTEQSPPVAAAPTLPLAPPTEEKPAASLGGNKPQAVRITVRTEPSKAGLFDEKMTPLGESPKVLEVTLPFEIQAVLGDRTGREVINRGSLGASDEVLIKLSRNPARSMKPKSLTSTSAAPPAGTPAPPNPSSTLKPGESSLD